MGKSFEAPNSDARKHARCPASAGATTTRGGVRRCLASLWVHFPFRSERKAGGSRRWFSAGRGALSPVEVAWPGLAVPRGHRHLSLPLLPRRTHGVLRSRGALRVVAASVFAAERIAPWGWRERSMSHTDAADELPPTTTFPPPTAATPAFSRKRRVRGSISGVLFVDRPSSSFVGASPGPGPEPGSGFSPLCGPTERSALKRSAMGTPWTKSPNPDFTKTRQTQCENGTHTRSDRKYSTRTRLTL